MKRIQYPNGYIGVCNDGVAKILGKRPGHKILDDEKEDKPKVGRPAKKEEEKE